MIEFAILLPILIMLFSGMVEFGFMLNTYMSLLDSTRQSARLCSNMTPFKLVNNVIVDDTNFSPYCAQAVVITLDPSLATPPDPNARLIVMDPTRDDVIVSILRVTVVANAIDKIDRLPEGKFFYSLYGNEDSAYSNTDIEDFMTQEDPVTHVNSLPVETGILIVEVYYGYEGILKLPWVAAFMSEADPIMLHASTIMPLVAAKP